MMYSLRSLIRFSIRDLALFTVIVALVLGWWMREVQLQKELARASRWRDAAGTLEYAVKEEGFDVGWQIDSPDPGVEFRMPGRARWRSLTAHSKPSPDQAKLGPMPVPQSQAPAPKPPNP
jgi:hypothetical protein